MFKNRQEAGEKLAQKLQKLIKFKKSLILALPRGGVPIGTVIADKLNLPLDIIIVKKLSTINNPELAFGAIAQGDVIVKSQCIIAMTKINKQQINQIIKKQQKKLKQQEKLYKRKSNKTKNYKQIIIVDDGLATGLTMQAAITAVEKLYSPEKIIAAVPVCAKDSANNIKSQIDQFICLYASENFIAVGQYYKNFNQVADKQVINLLKKYER